MRLPFLASLTSLASLALVAALAAGAAEPPPAPSALAGEGRDERSESGVRGRAWPLWDGQESVEQYARRANLEPTKTLDLGGGVKMEVVLIPAGKFVMGTSEPESPWIGGAILGAGGLVALVLLAMPVTRAIRQRRRPQFSLRWLILLVVVLGVAQYGGFRWWRAKEAWARFDGDAPDLATPAHEVTLTKPFYLGKFEVTQEQYQQAMGTNPSGFKGHDLPVEMVLWHEAQEFCRMASEKTGQSVRLPTEAEWEYACRAGTTTRFCTGDAEADLESVAWYGADSGGTTHPVGQRKSNAWGLYDMHGNLWEWCADWYADYGTGAVTDPQGPAEGADRMLRGGSWNFDPGSCRSAIRHRWVPDGASNFFGFRVVVEVPKTP